MNTKVQKQTRRKTFHYVYILDQYPLENIILVKFY